MNTSRINRLFFGAAVIAIASTTSMSEGRSQALPPGADAFVASANALAKSAAERVDLGRSMARLNQIKLALTTKFISAGAGGTIKLDTLDERALLCDVQAQHIDLATRRNYVQAVAGKVEAVGKPTQLENLVAAVRSLFTNQSLDIRGPISSKPELEALVKKAIGRCEDDIKGSVVQYYGRLISAPVTAATPGQDQEVPVAFLGPLSSH